MCVHACTWVYIELLFYSQINKRKEFISLSKHICGESREYTPPQMVSLEGVGGTSIAPSSTAHLPNSEGRGGGA